MTACWAAAAEAEEASVRGLATAVDSGADLGEVKAAAAVSVEVAVLVEDLAEGSDMVAALEVGSVEGKVAG
jgi:hypothetical protein